jgi:hypothetical protein
MNRDERTQNEPSIVSRGVGRELRRMAAGTADACQRIASEPEFDRWLMAALERERAALAQHELDVL